MAKADKTLAVTQAENCSSLASGSCYSYDWYDSGPYKKHTEDVAKAALGFTTSAQDAKLKFQKDETTSRQGYSLGLATVQKNRDQNVATAAASAASKEAGYQYSADFLFAVSQESQWRTNTTVDNAVALQKAIADAAFWSAQESAILSAVQALDTVYNLPWTDFLVAQADAHKSWWGESNNPSSAAGKYIQGVKDENTAQANYTNSLATSFHAKMEGNPALGITGINKAQINYATTLATAAQNRDKDQAQARYDEVSMLSGPTKTYLDNVAQAERDKANHIPGDILLFC